jgi:drug/metabolite transporter (DMT)-like permease
MLGGGNCRRERAGPSLARMTRRAWLAFAAVSVLWGTSYLFIKLAVRDGVAPVIVAWGRLVLATVILFALSWQAGVLGSLRGRWRWLIAYGFVEVSIPFPLIAFGEQRVSSSLAAIIIASVPLIGAVLAMRFDPSERPSPLRAAGLLIGFVGVVTLMGIDVVGSGRELLGAAAVLISAAGYAVGPMILKNRLDGLDPRALMAGGLLAGAVILTPLAVLDAPARLPRAGALGAIAVLGVVCTALAFVVMTVLIREAGTGRAMVITYVNPVIAVALGVILLGERPGTGAVLGLILILVGSWFSTGGRLRPGRGRSARHRLAAAAPVPVRDTSASARERH